MARGRHTPRFRPPRPSSPPAKQPPVNAGPAFSRALECHQRGQLADAEALYRQVLADHPGHAEALANLGAALQGLGRWPEALAIGREAVAAGPKSAPAQRLLGNVLLNFGKTEEAIAAYRHATALDPRDALAHNNLGNALGVAGARGEAVAAYRQALTLQPARAEIIGNLANALRDVGQMDEALATYRRAIGLRPEIPSFHNNLGMTLKDLGLLDEAIAELRTALRLQPAYLDAHSNLLYTLHSHPGEAAASIFAGHVAWGRQYGDPLARGIQPHANERSPGRRLRLGYVSPDFRSHVVGLFMLPILRAHDRAGFEVICYGASRTQDATTERIRALTDWRDIVGLGDAEAAELIRRDGVDILVDLAGHTAGHRLLLFARRPAPVQVTYLGYPGTTGLAAMDYRITDLHADPPGLTEQWYTETLLRLPETAWCYAPPPDVPAVGPGPVAALQPVTFGSFNNLAKLTGPMLALWAEILRAVPGSRLLLKNAGFGSVAVRQRVSRALVEAGIEAPRVELRGLLVTPAEHLAAYGEVDIALDTYPYHGTTTTCEALYMGVPVVSLAGQAHVSRVGTSILGNVGLAGLVAGSEDEYLRLAVALAGDRQRLRELRGSLRGMMERSPLMDAGRFTRHLEQAYREMWRRWCAGGEPVR